MVCLNWATLGTAIVRFQFSSFLFSHPAVRICYWLRNNPLWSDHYKRRPSQVFCHNKNVHCEEAGPAWLFLPTSYLYTAIYGNLNVFLDLYPIDLNNQGQSNAAFSRTHTQKNRQEKLESVVLSQLHCKLPAKVQLHDVTLSRLARSGCWGFVSKWRLSLSDFGLRWRLISWVRKHLRSWNFGE